MNSFAKLSRRLQTFAALLAFTLSSVLLQGASSYAGVYFGTYSGTGEQGNVAFLVGNDGWGAFLSYANNGDGGAYKEGFNVGTGGSFNFSLAGGTQVMGVISGSSLSGTYFGLEGSGSFNATLKSASGTLQSSVGYYTGNVKNGSGTALGNLRLILAADGSFRGVEVDLPDTGEVDDGYQATLNSQNQFNFTSVNSTTVNGSLAPATAAITGTWQNNSGTGPLTLTRLRGLDATACTYSLSASSTVVGAESGVGVLIVTAPDGCSWTTQTSQTWLHAGSVGAGNGVAEYWFEQNTSPTLRQGTITIGGITFTVTQGPAGFSWHNVFGWLYEAGGGWRHADGFGWMWFHSGGQWIWSGTLQGWLAITDPNSRTIWSTQFRWLTPVINDPYKADVTAFGTVYLGKYYADVIADGWVLSERFGYLWANGDGQWFYSDKFGWLGLTPEGGIWCVNQGRFL
jgi:hypothetical protein